MAHNPPPPALPQAIDYGPLLRGLIGLCAGLGVVALGALAVGTGPLSENVILSAVPAVVLAMLAAPGLLLLIGHRGVWRTSAGALTVGLCGLALALILFGIWLEPDVLLEQAGAMFTLCLGASQGALLLVRRRASDSRRVQWLTGATASAGLLLAGLIAGMVLSPMLDVPLRLVGALAVADVCGLAVLPLLRRLDRQGVSAPA